MYQKSTVRVLSVLLVACLPFWSGCRKEVASAPVRTAQVESGSGLDHEGFTKACARCHEERRPVLPHVQGSDCVLCHTPGTQWLDLKVFNHQPPPSSCVRCHEKDRVAPTFWLQTKHGQGADCVGCHLPGGAWGETKPFNHSSALDSCVACHETKRPLKPEHFGKEDCAKCHRPQPAGQPFVFEHKTATGGVVASCLPCHESRRKTPTHYAGQDCVGCHIDPAKTWRLSVASPHPQNSPMPQVCSSCHVEWRPTNHFGTQDCIGCHKPLGGEVEKFEFDHAATGANISTCLPCHDGKRPAAVVSSFSHSVGGQGDCVSCHLRPGETWTGGLFSHVPKPASCAGCHAADRPVGVIDGVVHPVTGDCASCHNRPGFTWSDGSYDHAMNPGALCASCHAARRPVGVINSFNHALVSGDCGTCHRSPGVAWSGGTYSHQPAPSLCAGCHQGARPMAAVGSGFLHSTNGTGDCAYCHKSPGVSWKGAQFSHTPAPATCASCHVAQRPATTTASGFRHQLTNCGRCHYDSHFRSDCSRCHFDGGVSWRTSTSRISGAGECTYCHDPSIAMAPLLGP